MFSGLRELVDAILFRDLKYFALGAFPLALQLSLARSDPSSALWEPSSAWEVAAFVFASYFLGIALYHLGMTCPSRNRPLIRMYSPREGMTFEQQESWNILVRTRALQNGIDTRFLERIIYIKEVNAAICLSLLTCALILGVYCVSGFLSDTQLQKQECGWGFEMLCLVALFMALCYASFIQNRSKAEIQNNVLRELDLRLTQVSPELPTSVPPSR